VELWAENEAALALFTSMATQWRMGFSGPIGLDYNPLFHRMDRMVLTGDEYEILFQDIRMAEAEALDAMANNKG
jgi:hypothetical protein